MFHYYKNEGQMKNRYLWVLLLSTMLFACSEDEDVSPSGLERNIFASADFSSEEEMAIRQDFFDQTGVYIVFNDSLCYREAKTPQGTYQQVELLLEDYELTGYSSHEYEYTLLADMQVKEEMAHVLANEVLPMLPDSLYPYAIFVADDFNFGYNPGWFADPMTPTGSWYFFKALIVGTNDFLSMSEADRYQYERQILGGILVKTHSHLDESVFEDFFAVCADLYGEYHDYTNTVMELGFLDGYSMFYYYEKEYDLAGYIKEIFDLSEEDFEEQYADYPIVLEKKDILVRILEEIGVTVY